MIINLSEEVFDEIYNKNYYSLKGKEALRVAVRGGTPIPKGHGRIADIDKVLEEMKATRTYDIPFALKRVKPIIEADKGE